MFTIKKRLFPFLGCIVLLMMGAAMLTNLETVIRKNNGSLKDYNTSLVENDYEDIDEGYYEITIDAVFECFATEGPSGNPDSWYYAVWLDDNSIAILVTDEEETAAVRIQIARTGVRDSRVSSWHGIRLSVFKLRDRYFYI